MTAVAPAHRKYVPLLRAAAVIIIATGSVWLWRASRTNSSPTPTLVAARTFSTKPGERRTITLEDSTEVILGVATRLEVAAGYGASVA
jgi:ferric-dicitrate binding protein FerR (iron transport regulator)